MPWPVILRRGFKPKFHRHDGAEDDIPMLFQSKLMLLILSAVMGSTMTMVLLTAITRASASEEYVVLLHGLARTSRSMSILATRLKASGFNVITIDYPSRKYTIEKLALTVGDHLGITPAESAPKVHFVTHSLGGILVRWLRKHGRMHNIGRVVMLSPPNKGSEVADRLKNNPLLKRIMGPAIRQLGTGECNVPATLGPVDFELGVITGNKSLNPLFSRWVAGQDDGKVSTESAKVEGMKDFLVVPHSHGFIMRSPEVADQVVFFLQNGRFDHVTRP